MHQHLENTQQSLASFLRMITESKTFLAKFWKKSRFESRLPCALFSIYFPQAALHCCGLFVSSPVLCFSPGRRFREASHCFKIWFKQCKGVSKEYIGILLNVLGDCIFGTLRSVVAKNQNLFSEGIFIPRKILMMRAKKL